MLLLLLVVALLVFIYIVNSTNIERLTLTGINDDFSFVPLAIAIPQEAILFDSLVTYNSSEFPDVFNEFTLYPYYQSFPSNINNIIATFIKTRIATDSSKTVSGDKIQIINKPYNVYYKGTDIVTNNFNYNREYIFTIDIEDLTHFFVRSYNFYISLSNENINIMSVVNASDPLKTFKFDTANNNTDVSGLNW